MNIPYEVCFIPSCCSAFFCFFGRTYVRTPLVRIMTTYSAVARWVNNRQAHPWPNVFPPYRCTRNVLLSFVVWFCSRETTAFPNVLYLIHFISSSTSVYKTCPQEVKLSWPGIWDSLFDTNYFIKFMQKYILLVSFANTDKEGETILQNINRYIFSVQCSI